MLELLEQFRIFPFIDFLFHPAAQPWWRHHMEGNPVVTNVFLL